MFNKHKDALSHTSLKEKNKGVPFKQTSVLIACPTFGLDPNPNQFLTTFLGVMNEFILRGWKVHTYFPYRRPIVIAENDIANVAITNGIDYIFRMDDDISGFQQGMVNKLVDANKEYISGVIYTAGFPYSLCAFNKKDKSKSLVEIYDKKELELEEIAGRGVHPCDMTATPFTLIKTTVYEKILTPYYEIIKEVPPDSVFCQKMIDAGIQAYVHMDVQLTHRWVTAYNRHYLYNADARAMLANNMIDKNSPIYQILAKHFGEDGRLDILQLKGCKIVDEE